MSDYWVVCALGFIITYSLVGLGPNAGLALFALLVLATGTALLWRPGETPILFFIFAFQWLEVSVMIFYANLFGEKLNDMSYIGVDSRTGALLGLSGLLVVAAGIRLAVGRYRPNIGLLINYHIHVTTQRQWFWLYVCATIVSIVSLVASDFIPGLAQPLIALANIKWAAFVMFTIVSFGNQNSNRLIWFAVFSFEFLSGFGGYFSSFKFVLVYSVIGILGAGFRPNMKQGILAGVMFTFAILAATTWTAVKHDYRDFLSGGQRQQIVTTDYLESVGALLQLMRGIDGKDFGDAFDRFVRRLSYVEYLGATTEHVPISVSHTNGAIWLDAFSRPFMPRLFFPEKSEIDDSEHTREYTGLRVAGRELGTQISIGYFGDAYIDFGTKGMMFFLFLYGLLLGAIYRWLLYGRKSRGILGLGLASSTLIFAASFGLSATKLGGSLVVSVLIVWIVITWVVPILFPWLKLTTVKIGSGKFTS